MNLLSSWFPGPLMSPWSESKRPPTKQVITSPLVQGNGQAVRTLRNTAMFLKKSLGFN